MRHTEQTRQKLSDMRRGEKNPFFGRKHTDAARERIGNATRLKNAARQYVPMKQTLVLPSLSKLAYVAGMIDADGSIRFRRDRPFVAIYNSHEPLIEWLQECFRAGAISTDRRGRVPTLCWSVSAARDVYALLIATSPLLIVKQNDARIALDHLSRKYSWCCYSNPEAA